MLFKYILIFVSLIISSVRRFINKDLLDHINNYSLYVYAQPIYVIGGLIFIMLGKVQFDKVEKLDYKNLGFLIATPILGIISFLIFTELIKIYEISVLNSTLSGLRNIFVLIIGVLFFGEELTKGKILGISLIGSGIYFMNGK
tara:strand:- start:418 stop:846 length:429 start_codon:yes stop_codon:yes gene_type:complete